MYLHRLGMISSSVMLALLALAAMFVWLPGFSFAAVTGELHVCKTGSGDYTTIQAAIDAAQPGDQIKVAAGLYTETKLVSAYPYNLYITKTVHLYGGYTCADWAVRDPVANLTSIRPSTADISVIVIAGQFGQGALLTPTIDGFTISGGGGGNHGGGIQIRDSDAVVSNNVIKENVGYLLGGGIWVQRGAPVIGGNQILNNKVTPSGSAYGGGIELEGTQAKILNNLIAGNAMSSTVGYGGGIAVDGGGPVLLVGNTISNNIAVNQAGGATDAGYGGGVSIRYAVVEMTDNLIRGNTASSVGKGGGGGIYISNTTAITITNNMVLSNTAGTASGVGNYLLGGGILMELSRGALSGNLLQGNQANRNTIFGNGGGLAALSSTVAVQGDSIQNNKVSTNCEGYGGGLYLENSKLTLNAARIQGNCAANTPFYGKGGGLAFINSPYTMTNGLVLDNYAFGNDTAVGGLYAGANSTGRLVNNSFVNNNGQGIRIASPLLAANNIIMGHTTGISLTAGAAISATYNDFYDNLTPVRGFTLGLTNIVINPQLDVNYRLLPGSPLIDAGGRNHAPYQDADGQPRPMAGSSGYYRLDIGADEFSGAPQIRRDLAVHPADFALVGPGNPQDNPDSSGSNDWIGNAVFAGDLNGDLQADLIVGAQNLSSSFDGGINDDGRVFALYNDQTRWLGVIDLYTTTADLEVRSWIHQQHIGQSVASADIDGDLNYDLLIGASGAPVFDVPGVVYIFAGGGSLGGTLTLSPTLQANYRVLADQNTGTFGGANALAAGQLDGSGASDIAIGDANAAADGRDQAGIIHVFAGSSSFPALWDLKSQPASLTIYGPSANAGLGKVALVDVNGDGKPDLIARSMTAVYVFYGPLARGVIDLAVQPADLTLGGLSDGRLAAGDVDGDGIADLLVGSGSQVLVLRGGTLVVLAEFSGVAASALESLDWNGDGFEDVVIGDETHNRAFVISGSPNLTGTADIFDLASWIITGELPGDKFGYSLSSGDLDGDGAADLIIGSRTHVLTNRPDPQFNDAGAVYVFYAQAPAQHEVYLPAILNGP